MGCKFCLIFLSSYCFSIVLAGSSCNTSVLRPPNSTNFSNPSGAGYGLTIGEILVSANGSTHTGPGPHGSREWIILLSLFFIALPGFIGNVCVVSTVIKSRKLKESAFIQMGSLALSDCMNNSIYWLVGTLSILNPSPNGFWSHSIWGSLLIISWFSTQFHMDLLAINRYIAVIHWQHYKRMFTTKSAKVMSGIIWSVCLILAIPFFAQHSLYIYHNEFDTFVYDQSAPGTRAFTIFSLCCSAISPTLMMFCSARIIIQLRRQRKFRLASKLVTPDSTKVHIMRKENVRLTIQFMLIFLAFTTATGLFNISLILHSNDISCPGLDLAVNIAHLLHFSINPLIYFSLGERFRQEFLALISCHRLKGYVGSTSANRDGSSGQHAGNLTTSPKIPRFLKHKRVTTNPLNVTPSSLTTSMLSIGSSGSKSSGLHQIGLSNVNNISDSLDTMGTKV